MTKLKVREAIKDVNKPVSQITLGTAFYNINDKEKWFEILDTFVEVGGTIIDSARGYGSSEDVIGAWLGERSMREKLVLITKCGLNGPGVLVADGYPKMVSEELSKSLETLGTDYIDVYMLHRDNRSMPVADILGPLNEYMVKGKIKALGASNWEYRRVDQANEYADKHGMTGFNVVSNNISLAVPTAAFYTGLVSTDRMGEWWHGETGIPLIPWSSQARGFFTGRYNPEMARKIANGEMDADGFTKRMVTVYCTDDNFQRLERAEKIGQKKGGYTAVEVALAWLLHKPYNIVPIVGPHTRDELLSCVKAASLYLSDDEIKWLDLK
ncbi:aldo/keto reductase [Candidatus Poribacteria bacterium]|nr:aldo/keto reductase [Candidatus Poribacteria bacterium]